MHDLEDLFRQVDAAEGEILELEQALVRIPSVNTGAMPTGNETAVCEYARDWLAQDGISAEILESAPGRGNLIARIEGRSDQAGLMFMSHTDVVPVEEEDKWALSTVQRHSCRRPDLRPGRQRLQGSAHRPDDGHETAQAQRHQPQGKPYIGLGRRRRAWRQVWVWLVGAEPPGKTCRARWPSMKAEAPRSKPPALLPICWASGRREDFRWR